MHVLTSCLILTLTGVAVDAGTYILLMPRSIQHHRDVVIPVHLLSKPYGNVRLTATLQKRYNKTHIVDVAEGTTDLPGQKSTGTVVIKKVDPTERWGSFYIVVRSTGVVSFKNESYVYLAGRRRLAIMVQTDKAVYKPGETVNFRIFMIDEKFNVKNHTLNVEIFDPKRNKMAEHIGVGGMLGYEDKFKLSDRLNEGQWVIRTEYKDNFNQKRWDSYTFDVREYKLPKFDVTLTAPSVITNVDTSISGKVKAAYTFGKPVKGSLVLSIQIRYRFSGYFHIKAVRLNTQLINGEMSFDVPLKTLYRMTSNMRYSYFRVSADVIEATTGVQIIEHKDVMYREEVYKIEFYPNMPNNFKPGFDQFPVSLKVTDQDNKPLIKHTQQMKITLTFFTDRPVSANITNRISQPGYDIIPPFASGEAIMMAAIFKPIEQDGTVKFNLDIPKHTATATIKAEYSGQSVEKYLQRFRIKGQVYLKVEMITTGPYKINDLVDIKLTTANLEKSVLAFYTIVGNGHVLTIGQVFIKAQSKQGKGQFRITREMVPSVKCIAYFQTQDGEIVADGINFVVEHVYENKVTVQFDQTAPTAEPKSKVNLRVTADPGSQINVLVVDESVRLLKTGNDITHERVKSRLQLQLPWEFRGWGLPVPWSINADDTADIFNDARLRVITDADVHKFHIWNIPQSSVSVSRSSERGSFAMSPRQPRAKLAGLAGSVSVSGSVPESPQGQIRKDFPETWVWHTEFARHGRITLEEIVPDTITKYVATAFALNNETGLGVATVSSNLTVFLPFFVQTQLPYSVIRDETAIIQANVFNYHPEDLYVNVRLQGSKQFAAVVVNHETKEETEITDGKDLTKCVLVKSGVPTAVFFSVRPKIIGKLTINIRATNIAPRNIFDEVIRYLPVKAEGAERDKIISALVSMQQRSSEVVTHAIKYPPAVVQGSQRIEISAIGDVFGPSFKRLDSLIRLPHGCGEQNMLYFAPSVFAAIYMKITGRFDKDLKLQQKIASNIKTGYQRQLLYKRYDGSFSAFGNADTRGSLWLTSFVLKSFAQALALKLEGVFIDPKVMDSAVNFIIKQQKKGVFVESGKVFNKAMQSKSTSTNHSLTAYVLICLHEVRQAEILTNKKTITKLKEAILLATSYLTELSSNGKLNTTYERAIGSYALGFTPNSASEDLLKLLESDSNKSGKGGTSYWKYNYRAQEIEIASYALMSYARLGDKLIDGKSGKDHGMKILKWLMGRRNCYGGFYSTQDTVVGLQALSQFAALIYSKEVDLTVEIYATTGAVTGRKQKLTLTSGNHDVLQLLSFPGDVSGITIEAKGIGLAVVDINTFYNVEQEPVEPSYELSVNVTNSTMNAYTLDVCARFLGENSESNMAIMDIGFISGFEPQIGNIPLTHTMKLKEMSAGRLMLYFDKITASKLCVPVPVQRVAQVAGVKPASVRVYLYYDPDKANMVSYLPDSLKTPGLCVACGPECGCGPDAIPELSLTRCDAPGDNSSIRGNKYQDRRQRHRRRN